MVLLKRKEQTTCQGIGMREQSWSNFYSHRINVNQRELNFAVN